MNRRGPENAIPLVLLAAVMVPALWTAQGMVWLAPWCLTFSLYFVGTGMAVVSVWLMVGWSAWKPSIAEVLTYLLGLTLLLVLTEGLGWLIPGLPPVDLRPVASQDPDRLASGFVSDPDLGWRLAPDAVAKWAGPGNVDAYASNAHGFRTVTSTAPSSAARLVFVGGGSVFGAGVAAEETFGALSAATLKRRPLLLALPGYGPAVTHHLVVKKGLPKTADVLVVSFVDPGWTATLPGPDGFTEWPRPAFWSDDGDIRLREAGDTPAPIFRWLARNSAGWRALYALDRQLGRFFAWGDEALFYQHAFTEMAERAAEANRQLLFVRLPLPTPVDHPFFRMPFMRSGRRTSTWPARRPTRRRSFTSRAQHCSTPRATSGSPTA